MKCEQNKIEVSADKRPQAYDEIQWQRTPPLSRASQVAKPVLAKPLI
jgi:hypothetical protein